MALNGDAVVKPVVRSLYTTPIKGFAVSGSEQVRLDRNGAVGDRDFLVVDEARRLLSIGRTGAFAGWRAAFDDDTGTLTLTSSDGQVLTDTVVAGEAVTLDLWESRGVPGRVVAGPWSGWLSDIAGRRVDLVRADDAGSGFDETPVTLLSEESVAELARCGGVGELDIRRFRMLINIAGLEPYQEESWRRRRVRVGSALLEIRGPVPRCNATTRNPDSGEKDVKTLRLIADVRGLQPNDFGEGLNLGVYADVVEPGLVKVGDILDPMPPGDQR